MMRSAASRLGGLGAGEMNPCFMGLDRKGLPETEEE